MATKNEKPETKWTSVRVLKDQYKRLSDYINTPEAKKLGYNSISDAVKQAISDVCNKIETEIKSHENDVNDEINAFLKRANALVEPKTHCCFCTPGPEFRDRHPVNNGVPVHTQLPNCRCNPENFVLNNNNN